MLPHRREDRGEGRERSQDAGVTILDRDRLGEGPVARIEHAAVEAPARPMKSDSPTTALSSRPATR